MIREEAIKFGKQVIDLGFKDETQEFCEVAIKALEQEPCEDCISRQAAIDAIAETIVRGESLGYAMAEDILYDVPSAQPEIIRCKDCKHYQFADNRAFGMPVKMCEWFGFEDVDDDDFCSRAERGIG